jgi:hypothetical protein
LSVDLVFHFSEDPTITSFVPHVPTSNPTKGPAVWAIDETHAPLYWFPRNCPRVACWARNSAEQETLSENFQTPASRIHAFESGWLDRFKNTSIYCYAFDASDFQPWPEAEGQWISHQTVRPVDLTKIDDLFAEHATAQIDLRLTPSLWELHDCAVSGDWGFSSVRMKNALQRPPSN